MWMALEDALLKVPSLIFLVLLRRKRKGGDWLACTLASLLHSLCQTYNIEGFLGTGRGVQALNGALAISFKAVYRGRATQAPYALSVHVLAYWLSQSPPLEISTHVVKL